jgi:hypothetical protein
MLGPTSALANGPSAGDQQYIDPLGGNTGSQHSHTSTNGAGSTSTSPASTPPATTPPATTPAAVTTTPATVTTTASTAATATTSTSTSAAPTASSTAKKSAADPQTLPMTGFDVWLAGAIGLGLAALGLSLRRAARRS